MKSTSSRLGYSALILLASGFVCKVLGALFRLPLTNFLGIEGIGVFQLVMSLYSFALVLTCGGVSVSLSKLIGTARAKGEYQKIKGYLLQSILVGVGIGLLLGILFLLLGNVISSLQGIQARESYLLFVLLLPLGAGIAAFRGFFQGFENMLPTAVSQVVEQTVKFALGLLFAFYFGRFGASSGVFGAFLGIVLSEVVAFAYIYAYYFLKRNKIQNLDSYVFTSEVRQDFNRANFLLMFSASIIPLTNAFDAMFIVPRLCLAGFDRVAATQLYGLQTGVVGAVLNFPLIISMAVTTALLPNISYAISRGVGGKHIIEQGLKILLFLILPTTFGMVAISKGLLPLIYKNLNKQLLEKAFQLMIFGGFSVIFTAFQQYLVMLLQANGEFRFILLSTFIGGLIKILLTFFLSSLPNFNIFALPLGNLLLSALVAVLAVWKLKRRVNFVISFSEAFYLIFSTVCMYFAVYTFVNCQYFNKILNVTFGVLIGVLVYAVFTTPFLVRLGLFERKEKKEV